MPYDKLVDSVKLDTDLKTVADAIRAKGETVEQLAFPDGFKTAIEGIKKGSDIEVGPFTYLYGGTYIPATDMEFFTAPGIKRSPYGPPEYQSFFAMGSMIRNDDPKYFGAGVEYDNLVSITGDVKHTSGYYPCRSLDEFDVHGMPLKAGVKYTYVFGYTIKNY